MAFDALAAAPFRLGARLRDAIERQHGRCDAWTLPRPWPSDDTGEGAAIDAGSLRPDAPLPGRRRRASRCASRRRPTEATP
ncbi:MAG: hypothetical protein ACFBWO_08195 [Paracoccaceae bacterium]